MQIPGQDRDPRIDARHGQGIAIGSRVTQNNYFLGRPDSIGVRALRVFISSVPEDLAPFSLAAAEVSYRLGLTPVLMGDADPQRTGSLQSWQDKVQSSDVFVLLLGPEYGPRPPGLELSYAEQEYAWAVAASRLTVLAFITDVTDVYPAARLSPDGGARTRFVECVTAGHEVIPLLDLSSFRGQLIHALSQQPSSVREENERGQQSARPLRPMAPTFHAMPPFVGNAPFTGRALDLDDLDAWGRSADPVLAVEALGGTGKSALTWQWAQNRAPEVIDGLAGRLWWSFYDGSASMTRFLQELLTYLTGQDGRNLPPTDLAEKVLSELRSRPYLVILDGFERLLAAYHSFDPSKLLDEELDLSKRSLIEANADEVVRQLTSAKPSKILISSRLMPLALQGRFGTSLAGVQQVRLPGLTDADTWTLVRRLGVRSQRETIAEFFRPLGNHPLLIGVVVGLVRDYRNAPGDFDRWLADPQAGGTLIVSDLDLTQRRTHILAAALRGLEPGPRRLLGWISVMVGAVTWETLKAINPFQAERSGSSIWQATAQLDAALKDLEDRALVWWDRSSNSYDMHPIIRAFAHDQLESSDRMEANNRVRDHFQALPPEDLARVASVEDLTQTITLFRALIGAGRFREADSLWDRFGNTLLVDIGASTTIVELLNPLVSSHYSPRVHSALAIAYGDTGDYDQAIKQYTTLLAEELTRNDINNSMRTLSGLAEFYRESGAYLAASKCLDYMSDLTNARGMLTSSNECLGRATLAALRGRVRHARSCLRQARQLGPTSAAPWFYDDIMYWQLYLDLVARDTLTHHQLDQATQQAISSRHRWRLAGLRYELFTRKGQFIQALDAAQVHERLGRNAGMEVVPAASAYVLAKLGRTSEATAAVEETLARLPRMHPALRPHLDLARAFWHLHRPADAAVHARTAYQQAWRDGPPNAHHWALRDADELLRTLRQRPPALPKLKRANVSLPLEGLLYRTVSNQAKASGVRFR